jgi:type VI secretion system secreted protein VgrG
MHRLALVETQEIFLEQSVPDVIRAKLARVDLGDVEMRLLGSYAKREYITQYRETDLAFVSRLAEHLGISFFFEEQGGLDRVVFTDHASGFQPVAGESTLPFVRRGETQSVHRLKAYRNVMPGLWAHQDYNYRIPSVDLTATHEVPDAFAGGVIEYAAHYKTVAEGQALARVRAEERQAICDHYEGASDVCWLSAGGRFTLTDHPRLDGNQDLLVVEIEHEIVQVTQTHGGDGVKRYENRFRAVPGGRTYRPPRVTPRPRIHGLLTARVEPREDQAIGKVAEIDEHGRYTIRFYFDTSPFGGRPKSSHRVRLIQHHVGPDYGTHLPLKAGVEVLVAFVDGDPDRPLIVGAAPNPVTPSPVNNFDAKMHRIKTASGILIQMKDHFKG